LPNLTIVAGSICSRPPVCWRRLPSGTGWQFSRRSPLVWLMRDLLLPVLWAAAWLRRDFSLAQQPMRIADRGRNA
jgi:hypothetical protein